jgi:hypothetical protein
MSIFSKPKNAGTGYSLAVESKQKAILLDLDGSYCEWKPKLSSRGLTSQLNGWF